MDGWVGGLDVWDNNGRRGRIVPYQAKYCAYMIPSLPKARIVAKGPEVRVR